MTHRGALRRTVAVAALGLLVAVVAWWPMLLADGGPTSDGRYFIYQAEIAKAAWREYHEISLWNPFDCAGIPMWDHPEAIVVSPLMLLMLPASSTATLIVWQLAHLTIGFVGMWLLARDDARVSRAAAFVASTLFACGAAAAGQYAGLHATMMGFEYGPLLFFLWRRAETSWGAAVGTGIVVAMMVWGGATYPLPFLVLIVAAETLSRITLRSLPRILGAGLVTAVVGVGLAAARLVPLVFRMGQGARKIPPDIDFAPLRVVYTMFTWRQDDTWSVIPKQQYHWHEYIAYVGVLGVVLAALGLIVVLRRGRAGWTILAAGAALLLMIGNFAPWAPWPELRAHVPPFGSMRVPSRFRHILLVPIALWIALAIDEVPRALRRFSSKRAWQRTTRALAVGAGVCVAFDSAGLGTEIVARRYKGDAPRPVPAEAHSPRFYYGGDGLAPDWMDQPSQNRAHTGCRGSFAFYENAPLWTGDVAQVRAKDPEAVTIVSSSRTHNTFTFVADARAPGRVLLNSAYDRNWRSNVGEPWLDRDLVAFDIPAGRSDVRVHYEPRGFRLGVAVSAAAAIAVGLFFWLRKRSAVPRVVYAARDQTGG